MLKILSIEATADRILTPGEILCFTPDAIHQIEAIGDELAISFNLYGVTDYDRRFKFNPLRATAEIF